MIFIHNDNKINNNYDDDDLFIEVLDKMIA